jgi:hypothetical protein
MKRSALMLATLTFLVGSAGGLMADITVYTSDFIPDASRSGYNGFESIPNNGMWYTGLPITGNSSYGPYTEGGITVQQVLPGGYMNQGGVVVTTFHPEGSYGWYATDFGYTRITKADGSDFANIGFEYGSGFTRVQPTYLYYALFEKGQPVASDHVYFLSDPANTGTPSNSDYLGFAGGGFDEIWLRDCNGPTHFDYTLWQNVLDVQTGDPFSAENLSGYDTALAIDAIEVSTPEPSSLVLVSISALGLLGYALTRRSGRAVRT